MKDRIRFGIIGHGRIGKRHAEIIGLLPGAELVAICDINPAEEQGLPKGVSFYLSIADMLAIEDSIDVVTIATPNGLHCLHALAALGAGKHVLIEKPMGLTKASCEEVVQKGLQMKKEIFCIMQNRYSPPSVWLKQLVESKKLGKIFMVTIDCFWNRDERYYKNGNWKGTVAMDGGTLFTQFSHFIDVMYWLFGDVHDIIARFYDFNHRQTTEFEDSGTVNFNFADGAAGVFSYSTSVWNKNFESTLTIIAEHGTVKVGGQYMNEVLYCHVKDYSLPLLAEANPANDYGSYKGSAANHALVFENVLEVLNGRSAIGTNAMEGIKVVEIIENIYRLKQTNPIGEPSSAPAINK